MAKKKTAARKKKITRNDEPKGTVLVTGAAGFTGSTTVDLLIEKGYSVVATDREDAIFLYVRERQAMVEREGWRYKGQKIEIVPADLTRRETLRALFRGRKIRYILHAGAVFDMSAPWKLLYNVNVMGTKNLLEVAADARHVPGAT
ncbi:MAG: GDP-mannose 4,6-dehydratase, partial [bacterium]